MSLKIILTKTDKGDDIFGQLLYTKILAEKLAPGGLFSGG